MWARAFRFPLYSIPASTFQFLAASRSPPGPISPKFQSRALSIKGIALSSNLLCVPVAAHRHPRHRGRKHLAAVRGGRHCREGWRPNDRAGWGRGACSAPAPAPALGTVTHRREAAGRGEQPPTGAGRRGRQVQQVRSAPPRAQSAQSVGQFTSCPGARSIQQRSSPRSRTPRLAPARPPAGDSFRAPSCSVRAAWRPPRPSRSGCCSWRRRRWPRLRKVGSGIAGLAWLPAPATETVGKGRAAALARRESGPVGEAVQGARSRALEGALAPAGFALLSEESGPAQGPRGGPRPRGSRGTEWPRAGILRTLCATRVGAQWRFWSARDQLGPGRDSATATFRPAPPGAPATGPGCRLRRGQVAAGRPPGRLPTCAGEEVCLDFDYGACRCFLFLGII